MKVCQVKPVERRSKKGNEEKQRTVPKGAGASESGRFHSSTGEKYRGEAGKPSALKDACSVWSGGKTERPYLSLFMATLAIVTPNR